MPGLKGVHDLVYEHRHLLEPPVGSESNGFLNTPFYLNSISFIEL